MTLILSGTNGVSDIDGDASTPAIRGTDANTGIFFGSDIIGFSEGGTECARFNADAQFVAAAGTASLPVITTTGDVNTGIFFPAADTIAFAEGGAEAMRIDSSGNLQFNSGYGSVATAYGCRAWVNFNGTGTPAIREDGNVSSITDNGTLSYQINFATAMPDVNYNYVFGGTNVNDGTGTNYTGFYATTSGTSTGSLAFVGLNIYNGGANQAQDNPVVNVSIFR